MTKLKNAIFVFGSNLSGVHGAGAALYALKEKGAVLGEGLGQHGKSYALPTKGYAPRLPTLKLAEINVHAKQFTEWAEEHPKTTFQLTAVGCGLAGYTAEQIGPLFTHVPTNVLLPPEWQEVFSEFDDSRFWSYADA